MTDTSSGLTATQSAALLDILTHHETYAEIEDFKTPGAIKQYGPPFQDSRSKSSTPLLQALVSKFVLRLPGLKDIKTEFWKTQVSDLIEELSQAELSESYDKGILGVRKTLATAISALIEYPARGSLGGFPKRDAERSAEYNVSDPEDVMKAWQDSLQEIIYGDLIDELIKRATETDDLLQHDTLVQGMHEFIIVNIASLMHYTLILSPEGPTLLRMIENVHRLLPYVVIRQTLKIGNVATMINAMMKVILAKTSVGMVTNWIGLTSGANEGMNLLQQIISQVLSWDKRDLRSRADKIEKKGKDAPPKKVREALIDWIKNRSREEHAENRRMSQDQKMSIVAVILNLSDGPSADDLTETQHNNALEWFALQLSIRDRQEIVRVLCHRNPDHLTAAINNAADAYTPMIRQVHQAVNLADTMWDFERFVTDMLKMSKPSGPKGEEKPPSVEDYVELLHRHQSSSHKFLHQVAKNGKEVLGWWTQYAHDVRSQFRNDVKPAASESVVSDKMATGSLQDWLQKSYGELDQKNKKQVRSEIDAYAKYLDALHKASASRITSVINKNKSTPFGPGAYLARWQNLLDNTLITPGQKSGPVRKGANKEIKEESRAEAERAGADVVEDAEGKGEAGDASVAVQSFLTEEEVEKIVDEKTPAAPKCDRVVELFGRTVREMLGGEGV